MPLIVMALSFRDAFVYVWNYGILRRSQIQSDDIF